MATTTNAEFWNAARAYSPEFKSHTAEATAETFKNGGWEAFKQLDNTQKDAVFGLSVKVFTQDINEMRAIDPLERQDFGEYYNIPYGAIIQRLSTEPVLPISPAYSNLKNGDSPDPFVVYKPDVAERFFPQNFDYASLITMPDDYVYKVIFTSNTGMYDYLQSQVLRGLEAGYIAQKYLNKKEALNAYLNSTKFPLKDSQKINWQATAGAETQSELAEFVVLVRHAVRCMTNVPYTSAYNSYGHANTQDRDRLRLVVRTGFMDMIDAILMANSYHDEQLNLPIKIVEVNDFGGLVPYQDAEHTVALYPAYDALGHDLGYSTEQNAVATKAEDGSISVSAGTYVSKEAAHYLDPNASIVGLIADKGLLFEGRQNPYSVEPIRNPRGRYTNMWASSPNNTVAVDPVYNCMVITENGQA